MSEVRREFRLTQRQMAGLMMVDRSTYSKHERGETVPGLDALAALAVDKGISMDWLICGRGGMSAPVFPMDGSAMEFAVMDDEMTEFLTLMHKDPGFRHLILGQFHRFKEENGSALSD